MSKYFDDEAAQDAWVAAEIAKNLNEDEIEPDDILIVLPSPKTSKSRAVSIDRALRSHQIDSHLVGVTSSADEVFQPGSIAIAHIYRAKGNEAPMVYVMDAQHAAVQFNQVTRRNTLFTAITRSRAWVRITGCGAGADAIAAEIEKVVGNDFKLKFKIPTSSELETLRHIHRDRPAEHEAALIAAKRALEAFLDEVSRGELDLLDLPPDLRTRLVQLQRERDDDGP